MKKIYQYGFNAVMALALFAAIWLADGIEATGKELAASFIIVFLTVCMYCIKYLYEHPEVEKNN